jgi:peptidoglycan hydrolase-like protein with peptidoglycan-binding domain
MPQKLIRRLAAPVVLAAGLAVGTVAVTASPASATASCGYYSGNAETVKGDTGNRVREIQCLLVYTFGYDLGSSGPSYNGVDGQFGTKTYNAVLNLQRNLNDLGCPRQLSEDGKVGTHTWSALRNAGCPTA